MREDFYFNLLNALKIFQIIQFLFFGELNFYLFYILVKVTSF